MIPHQQPEHEHALLIHEISTALAVAKGRAQLLQRMAPDLEEPARTRLLHGLTAIDEAVMRAYTGLIMLQTSTYHHRDSAGHANDPSPD